MTELTAVERAAACSVLREVIRLADQAPVLTEEQLRFRLLALAERAIPRSHLVKNNDDARSPREAVVLDDPGADPGVAGARSVRLPATSVEPVDGLTHAARVTRLSDHGHGRGSKLKSEGTSLPTRVPGTHLHPQLRRSPSWTGPSSRAGSGT